MCHTLLVLPPQVPGVAGLFAFGSTRRDKMQKIAVTALLLMALASPARAEGEDYFTEPCEALGIPRPLVMAIAQQESGLDPWLVNVSGVDHHPKTREEAVRLIREAQAAGTSFDVGLMQINSQWHRKWSIDPVALLEPQFNVEIGLMILQAELQHHGLTWEAIGKYHSPDAERGRRYAWRVYRRLAGANDEKKTTAARKAAYHHASRKGNIGRVWRNHGIERKGRLVTFGVRAEGVSGAEDREPPRPTGPDGATEDQR